MAGEEDKKNGQSPTTQAPDQKKSGVFTHPMDPSDMKALSLVLGRDPKYYADKLGVAGAVNRLKDAGVPLTDAAIIEEYERAQAGAQKSEAAAVGVEAVTTPEIESTEKILREKIEQVRSALKDADTLFSTLQKKLDDHFSRFPNPASMTPEQRMVEFGLLSPAGNTDAQSFFRVAKKIDFSMYGEIGHVYKKLLSEKNSAEPQRAEKEYRELESICAHDLSKCVRVANLFEVVLLGAISPEEAKEKASSGSGDLVKIRDLWVAIGRVWGQGFLLQEDLNTRFMKKDEVLEEDQHETTLERVLDTLKLGVDDERRSKISGDSTIDPAAKKAKVKLNEGALYFILRNIAYNPIRKGYIEATKVEVRVELVGEKQMVVVEIEDNGFGIEPAMRQRIFNPGETGAKSSSEGVGMGLAYSDKRLKSMGIGVDIVSDRNVSIDEDKGKFGTKFVITIPIIAEKIA